MRAMTGGIVLSALIAGFAYAQNEDAMTKQGSARSGASS
jgi:hypothetical protein